MLHLVDGDIGIENININNGTVTGDGTTHAYGGGVLIEAGNTTLTNVVFDGVGSIYKKMCVVSF